MVVPVPYILVDGKKMVMPKPKIFLYRQMVAFSEKEKNGELNGDELFDAMIEIIAVAFDNKEITKEVVEKNLPMEDLSAIFLHIKAHVEGMAMLKASQFPNVKTPMGKR